MCLCRSKSVVRYSFLWSNLNTVRDFLHTDHQKYRKVFKIQVEFEYSTSFFAYGSAKVLYCIHFFFEFYDFCSKIWIQYDTFQDTHVKSDVRYAFSTWNLNTVRHFWVYLCKNCRTVCKFYVKNAYLTVFSVICRILGPFRGHKDARIHRKIRGNRPRRVILTRKIQCFSKIALKKGFGTLWGAQGRSGVLWGALGRSGVFWGALGRSGPLWGALGRSGALWGALGRFRAFWGVLERLVFNFEFYVFWFERN